MRNQITSSLRAYFQEQRKKIFGYRIKCFVIHFNRPTFLLRLLEVLSKHPKVDIYVVDNCSLNESRHSVTAIAERFGAQLILMDRNYGHSVVWDLGLSVKYSKNEPYLVTDCDVIPNSEADYIAILEKGLMENPKFNKIGLELNVSRIPEGYPKRANVIEHEKGYLYRKILNADFQECPVDTTFALYRAGYHNYSVWGTDSNEWVGHCQSLRTVQPRFEADHLGWHVLPPYDEETIRYFESIRNSMSGHWKE